MPLGRFLGAFGEILETLGGDLAARERILKQIPCKERGCISQASPLEPKSGPRPPQEASEGTKNKAKRPLRDSEESIRTQNLEDLKNNDALN